MQNFVLAVLRMSLETVFVFCIVLMLRFLFRKLPKGYTCILWMFLLIRLLCPVFPNSSISLMPDVQGIWEENYYTQPFAEREAVNGIPTENLDAEPEQMTGSTTGKEPIGKQPIEETQNTSATDEDSEGIAFRTTNIQTAISDLVQKRKHGAMQWFQSFWNVFGNTVSLIWLLGVGIFTVAYLFRYIRLHKLLRFCKREEGFCEELEEELKTCQSSSVSVLRIWEKTVRILECTHIPEPFVCGIFRPVICLPDGMEKREREYILCHERMHIRHLDPLVRLLWQAALVLHWFNPLIWLAISLVQKDMEMCCDESVMRQCGDGIRKEYAMTLLHFSVKKSGLPFPMAFGESNTESRIRHILNVKKPVLAASLSAGVVIVIAGVVLLTNSETTNADMPRNREEQMLYVARQCAEAFSDRNGSEMAELLADPSKLDDYEALLQESEKGNELYDKISITVPNGLVLDPSVENYDDGMCLLTPYVYEGGAYAPKAWTAAGMIGRFSADLLIWNGDKIDSIRPSSNYTLIEPIGSTEELILPGYIVKETHTLYTPIELKELEENGVNLEELDTTSEYWYIFMCGKEDEFGYVISLNTKYYTLEDTLNFAKSLKDKSIGKHVWYIG